MIVEGELISFFLPANLRVVKPMPGMLAKRGLMMVAVVEGVCDTNWEASLRKMRRPLINTNVAILKEVESGLIEAPYLGHYRAVEDFALITERQSCHWDIIADFTSCRVSMTITGPGSWNDVREDWEKIACSMRSLDV